MQITLDGVVSGAEKWFSENYSDDAFNNGISLYEAAAAQLLGFGAYVGMASYWQNAAVDPNASALDATMGRILNAKKKVVFSKKDEKLKWENSEIRQVKNDGVTWFSLEAPISPSRLRGLASLMNTSSLFTQCLQARGCVYSELSKRKCHLNLSM